MKTLFESALKINKNIKKLINQDAINSFGQTLYQGDNANYCISLFQDYLVEPDNSTKLFLSDLGQSFINWTENNLDNGYFKMEDVHHGTEVFLGFLPRYIDLFPDDQRAKNLIIDVAEYIGNWKENTYDWFDYSKNNFRSWFFGSKGIHQSALYNYNTADHLRLVHISLMAWEINFDKKYLEWSASYGKEFAKKIISSSQKIPVAWDKNWKSFYPTDMSSKEEKFLAANHHHLPDSIFSGEENLIASGAIYIFGYLYQNTNEKVFKDAAKIILNNILHLVLKPYADNLSVLLNYYRSAFNDYSFDEIIIKKIDKIPQEIDSELMIGFPEIEKIRADGIGNRKDMIYWYHINNLATKISDEPPTSFFMLAYNITGDLKYAQRALKTAARKIKLSSSLLRSGYEHSDSGKLFSSVVSGHGRNWGVGAVTGCYSGLISGSNENLGIYDYKFKFLSKTLSNGCLPLTRGLLSGETELLIYNFANITNTISFIYKKNNKKFDLDIEPNSVTKKLFL